MRAYRTIGWPALALLVSLAPAACRPRAAGPAPAAAEGYEKRFERGPVSVLLKLDRREATIADRLHLNLEVTAAEDYEVELPGFGEKLEQFGIVDYRTSQPELVSSNRTRQVRSYVLEPFLSGDYTLPAMEVSFWRKGATNAPPHTVETEPVSVKIKSLLPAQRADLKIHDIVPPVPLPRAPLAWAWAAAGGVLAAAGAVALVFWRRRRRPRGGVARRIPAHELAYRQLEALVAQELTKKGEIKRFYQGVSDILRQYIENRFGLHAPEQTTEEFLVGLDRAAALPPQYRPLLAQFLTHCDMVKFAELQPGTAEIQKTFDSCREFIDGTRQEEAAP